MALDHSFWHRGHLTSINIRGQMGWGGEGGALSLITGRNRPLGFPSLPTQKVGRKGSDGGGWRICPADIENETLTFS